MHSCSLYIVEYDEEVGESWVSSRDFTIQADENYFTGYKFLFHVVQKLPGVTPAKPVILWCYQCEYSLTSAIAPQLPFRQPSGHYQVYRGVCNGCSGRDQPSDSEEESDEN